MKQKTHIFAVCAYGESPYLDECVRSLLAQTVKSEIILVTSTPNDHIRKCADRYGLRVLVNRGQGGITQDWNYAYTHSHARYVTIAHQDDFYEPDFLENALKRLEKSRKPLIFFTDYFEIRDGCCPCFCRGRSTPGGSAAESFPLAHPSAVLLSLMLKRTCLTQYSSIPSWPVRTGKPGR